jgi:hypothetical protein
MPIPTFNLDGVLPPFIGPDGPGGLFQHLSPYETDALEVVTTFATTSSRCEILRGLLDHRTALRALGIVDGFQWLDGSFVEDKVPNDVDVVTFFHRPPAASQPAEMVRLLRGNPDVFDRRRVKALHMVDFLYVDLDGTPEAIVDSTRYWAGVFAHCRATLVWKGMVKISLADMNDADARTLLTDRAANLQ